MIKSQNFLLWNLRVEKSFNIFIRFSPKVFSEIFRFIKIKVVCNGFININCSESFAEENLIFVRHRVVKWQKEKKFLSLNSLWMRVIHNIEVTSIEIVNFDTTRHHFVYRIRSSLPPKMSNLRINQIRNYQRLVRKTRLASCQWFLRVRKHWKILHGRHVMAVLHEIS